jgi:uncharacterized peroxidase-related enzyme
VALINLVPPEEAKGKLAELYAMTEQFFGSVPNNVQLLGVNPDVLENQIQFAASSMEHATLSMELRALIRMLVAHQSGSSVCDHLNAAMLKQQGVTEEQIEAIRADPAQVPLSDQDKAMLLFVLKGTADPHGIEADDIRHLRGLGWSEQDIFDAVAHGARAVYANLIFDVFKLEAE